eukprot:13071947-Heterocapsa_arctica.AAC.1
MSDYEAWVCGSESRSAALDPPVSRSVALEPSVSRSVALEDLLAAPESRLVACLEDLGTTSMA